MMHTELKSAVLFPGVASIISPLQAPGSWYRPGSIQGELGISVGAPAEGVMVWNQCDLTAGTSSPTVSFWSVPDFVLPWWNMNLHSSFSSVSLLDRQWQCPPRGGSLWKDGCSSPSAWLRSVFVVSWNVWVCLLLCFPWFIFFFGI